MEVKIYIDVMLLSNFFFNLYLLRGTGHLLHIPLKKRYALAAFLGALYGVFAFFLPRFLPLYLLLRLPIAALMVALSFPSSQLRVFVKYLAVFLMLSLFLGGSLYFLLFSTPLGGLLGAVAGNGSLYLNLPLSLLIILPLFSLLIKIAFSVGTKSAAIEKSVVSLQIQLGGKTAMLRGFYDSGNQLTGPDGRGIIITESRLVAPLLPEAILNHLPQISFRTLQGVGTLRVFIPDAICLVEGRRTKPLPTTYIGISDTPLNQYHNWDSILPQDLEGVLHHETSVF